MSGLNEAQVPRQRGRIRRHVALVSSVAMSTSLLVGMEVVGGVTTLSAPHLPQTGAHSMQPLEPNGPVVVPHDPVWIPEPGKNAPPEPNQPEPPLGAGNDPVEFGGVAPPVDATVPDVSRDRDDKPEDPDAADPGKPDADDETDEDTDRDSDGEADDDHRGREESGKHEYPNRRPGIGDLITDIIDELIPQHDSQKRPSKPQLPEDGPQQDAPQDSSGFAPLEDHPQDSPGFAPQQDHPQDSPGFAPQQDAPTSDPNPENREPRPENDEASPEESPELGESESAPNRRN